MSTVISGHSNDVAVTEIVRIEVDGALSETKMADD